VIWTDGRLDVEAVDLSRRGAFLHGDLSLPLGSRVTVLFMDENNELIRITARVARTVTSANRDLGGIGVELVSAPQVYVQRYRGLVERVSRRVERHVVVVAPAQPHVQRLVNSLAAVGYSAVGAIDPRKVFALATTPLPADAVVLDGSMSVLYQAALDPLKERLRVQAVRTLEVDASRPVEARQLLDAALDATST
jgi:hypothetical protein